MSVCSAEEIAKKRRIAIEKLKTKKSEIATTVTNAQGNVSGQMVAQSFYGQSNNIKSKNNEKSSQPAFKKPKYEIPVPRQIITCTCYMISSQRFVVNPSEFSSKIIEIFKSIPSKNYDPNNRLWSFDIKDYDLVHERFENLKPNITIKHIPKKVIKLCTSEQKELNYSCLASLNHDIRESLLPFQREGVCFGISKHGRVLIADEMGLGKTYQALALADFYRDDFPVLIATTALTRNSWVTHIRKLLPYIACQHVCCLTTAQDYFSDAKIVVSSYSLLEKCHDKLLEMNFGVLIMDESHTLKNSKAKCTAVVDNLSKKARRIIMLTATPALSRPVELYSQLKMIDHSFLNFMDYTTRYCDGKSTAFGWNANGQSNLCELNVILNNKFMIRRLKADVLPQLAEKNRETLFLDPELIWSGHLTKESMDGFKDSLSQTVGRDNETILLNYYAQTAIVKSKAVCSYLKSLVKENIKFIVFAHHKVMLDNISTCLKNLDVKHIRIDGSTSNDLRSKYLDTFQKNEKCQVAVLSLKACNTGITLTAAQLIVFAELDWNPSTLVQAESRAHRIGQEGTVTCRYLLAQNTADDIIWKMLNQKQEVLCKAGLFCENLQNNQHINVPSSSGNIQKYLIASPRPKDKTKVLKEKELNTTVEKPRETTDDFDLMTLLDDDNDFENLVY